MQSLVCVPQWFTSSASHWVANKCSVSLHVSAVSGSHEPVSASHWGVLLSGFSDEFSDEFSEHAQASKALKTKTRIFLDMKFPL